MMVGSIPACAGEPAGIGAYHRRHKVYPRLCGGTLLSPGGTTPPTGLSPPVRGNRAARPWTTNQQGSIPACAGEPHINRRRRDWRRVYPRLCGGTMGAMRRDGSWKGLSPPVRGNPENQPSGCTSPRSIPACAGEPSALAQPYPVLAVYPRLCGGTALGKGLAPVGFGLSPPVRGNLQ